MGGVTARSYVRKRSLLLEELMLVVKSIAMVWRRTAGEVTMAGKGRRKAKERRGLDPANPAHLHAHHWLVVWFIFSCQCELKKTLPQRIVSAKISVRVTLAAFP